MLNRTARDHLEEMGDLAIKSLPFYNLVINEILFTNNPDIIYHIIYQQSSFPKKRLPSACW